MPKKDIGADLSRFRPSDLIRRGLDYTPPHMLPKNLPADIPDWDGKSPEELEAIARELEEGAT